MHDTFPEAAVTGSSGGWRSSRRLTGDSATYKLGGHTSRTRPSATSLPRRWALCGSCCVVRSTSEEPSPTSRSWWYSPSSARSRLANRSKH